MGWPDWPPTECSLYRPSCCSGPPGHQVAATSQPYDFPGETHSTGPSPHVPPSVHSQGQLGPVVGPPLYTGTHITGRPLSPAVVELPPQLASGGPPTPPLPQLQVFTNASTEGWGAHLMSHQTSGTWSRWQRSLHINNLELLAGHLALQHFLPLVINKVMIVMTDNTTVVGQIKNQGGTHSRSLYPQTVLLLEWADSRHITLVRATSWDIWMWWLIDCPVTPDHQLRVDTVSADTPPRVAPMGPAPDRPLCHFGNCPPAHVRLSTPGPGSVEDWRLVLSRDRSVGLHVSSLPSHSGGSPEDTGIQLPCHPSGPSMAVSTLASPSTASARQPPKTPTSSVTLLRQPQSWIFHLDPSCLSLHIWRLSSRPSSAEAIPRQWQPASPCHTVSPHSLSTTASGTSSLSGAGTLDTIRSLPLLLS